MSTKEIAYNLIEKLSEEQLKELIVYLQNINANEQELESVRGIFSHCANKELIKYEKQAWEREVYEKHKNS